MKIIKDLAQASVEKSKKDTLAIKISIILAVLILGTVIFIINSIKKDEYDHITSTVGDYQVSLSGIDENIYDKMVKNEDIKKVSFAKIITTNLDAEIYEKEDYGKNNDGYKIIEGRNPEKSGELIVPEGFLSKNKDYKLGSKIKTKDKTYTIVGVYDSSDYSFEESILIGLMKDPSKDYLFGSNSGLVAYI